MRLLEFLLMVACFFTVTGCEKSNYVTVCSADFRSCVTHFSLGSIQVLADGTHKNIPDSNFVIVDVSHKDLAVDNSLNICWGKNEDSFEWEAVISNSKIILSNLDTSIHRFKTYLPTNELGFPSEAKFRDGSCATLSIDRREFSPPTSSSIIKDF